MRKFDLGEYKSKLAQEIINSDNIVKAIDSSAEEYDPDMPDSLLGVNIFPHIFIPKIQTSTQTYIMLSCEISNINNSNPTFHNIKLTIRVMAHKGKLYMKNERSTRIDYISSELISLLEDSDKYGVGTLRLSSDREIILNENYIFRELAFKTVDIARGCR